MISETLGDSLRQLRLQKRISLRSLAEKTDFSPSFISQIENGLASPSINSMEKIAAALGVPLWEFFHVAEKPKADIIRAAERSRLNLDWSRAVIESLGYSGDRSHFDAVMVAINPGGISGKHGGISQQDEFAFIHDGEVVLTLDEADHLLNKGDSVIIPAGMRRRWRNDSASPVQVLVVSVRPNAL
jgi:transcriptional regulator with XRE-family HTH domain